MQLDARDYRYPDHVWRIREIPLLQASVDAEIDDMLGHAQSMEDSLLIDTADAAGISRYERILGITPQDTDTLEDRRYAVKLRWHDTFPYTEADLRARLDRLIPGGDYELIVDTSVGRVSCYLALTSAQNLAATHDLLDHLIPLHIVIDTGVRYNTYNAVGAEYSTYNGLSAKTHKQLKEDVIES